MKPQYKVLGKYLNGRIVDKEDEEMLEKLSLCGLIHNGTHIEMNDETFLISVIPTARATKLGVDVYETMRPTRVERLMQFLKGLCGGRDP